MVGARNSDGRSDEQLVDACNHGSAAEAHAAFETLYRRHKDFVMRVAMRYVRDNEMALDVLHESFTYLLRKFPPAGDGLTLTAKLTSLLYPVAKNSAISMMRKADRFPSSPGTEPDDLAGKEEQDSESIKAILDDLSPEHREVILLRFVDDMPLADIAAALDLPVGTVKSRLHLALGRLRKSPQVKDFFEE